MRAGGDRRGNCRDRAARKRWLLSTFGDGRTCSCVHCGLVLDYGSVEADRIVPGSAGGSYRRSNLQPACRHCNASRSNRAGWRGPLVRAAAGGRAAGRAVSVATGPAAVLVAAAGLEGGGS